MDAQMDNSDCPGCTLLQQSLSAARQQIEDLQKQVQLLQQEVKDLKSQLNQNSSNSSKPPSSDLFFPKRRPKPPTGRKPGGQKGHKGHHRKRLPKERVDQFIHYLPDACGHCQAELPKESRPCDPPARWHQVAEVPPLAAVITEHQAHGRLCSCGNITFATIPDAIRKHAFGPRLCALISYLSARCHDGKRMVKEILGDVLGVPISLGSVCAKQQEMRHALRRPYAQAQRHVKLAPVKHLDETGWFQKGEPRWLWLGATGKAALFRIHRRRTRKALQSLLGRKEPQGTIITDRFGAYDHWSRSCRQLCWAHLKRDFVRWKEAGLGLGTTGLLICRQVFCLWRDFRAGKLTRPLLLQGIEPIKKRLRGLLMWWRDSGKGKARKFASHLLDRHASLWTFVRQEGVDPTNNHAERLLRPAVLWRKNSFGHNSNRGRVFVERILTAVASLRLQHRNVLDYLTTAIDAHRNGLHPPRLIKG